VLHLSSSLTSDIISRTVQFLANKEQILLTFESANMRGCVRKYPTRIALEQYIIICIWTVASFSHIIFIISKEDNTPGHKLLYASTAV